MALKVSGNKEYPTGAIRLDRGQAITYQENRIENWRNPSDTWYLRNGSLVLAGGGAASAFAFMSFFWRRLRIGKTILAYTYVPTMMIPAATAAVYNEKFVKEPILLQEIGCPVCAEVRWSFFNMLIGVGQSYFMSLFTCVSAATLTYSYPIPELNLHKPHKYLKFMKKICRESKSRVGPVLVLNLALSNYIIYKFQEEMTYLNTVDSALDLENFNSEFE